MRRITALFVWCLLAAALTPANALGGCASGCSQGYYSGVKGPAEYLICIPPPSTFNGGLVVFAHGYVAPSKDGPRIPWDQLLLPDGSTIPELVTSLGFGFATTGYSKDGLAIVEGIEDVRLLVNLARGLACDIQQVFLVGASEGSLVVTKLMESDTQFSGALALCGPCGDFAAQLNHIGDFRVVFDYFFPRILPPSPVAIPDYLINQWGTYFPSVVLPAVQSRPLAAAQVLSVTKVFTAFDPANTAEAFENLLRYNVTGTNDALAELGGQPFDNSTRRYSGSLFDWALNRNVQRFTADPTALAEISAKYQTTGRLKAPLVNMHTTWDPLVPYSQAQQYGTKVLLQGKSALYAHIPIVRFGHCRFTKGELLFAFYLMVLKSWGQ